MTKSTTPHVLLIDDDQRLAELLARYFERFDLDMVHAAAPSSGLKKLDSGHFDLVILDVMLPEMDGFEVCKAIRKTSDIPIIMLTARGDVMDRVVGLEIGADDYLAKPFEPRELVARIQNILKRTGRAVANGAVLDFGMLVVDKQLRSVMLNGELLSLSSMEYQLLEMFARQPGKTFSRDEILNTLKGVDADDLFTRSVDILISRLRTKLKPLDCIRTQRGSGYCFVGKVTS
jgi:two-component system, OmpR family, response regulator